MKKILIIGLMVMVAAVGANATETRVLTMGDNNNIMIDDANVWLYPGRTFDYPNIGTGEFASADFNKFGFTWKFGEKKPWVMGIYFSKGAAIQPMAYGDGGRQFGAFYNNTVDTIDIGGTDILPNGYYRAMQLPDNRRLDLLYGRKIGGVNFGLNFGYVSSSVKTNEINDKAEEGFSILNFVAGLTSQTGNWDLAVGFAKGSWTDLNATGKDESEPDGYTDFSVRARLFHKLNQTITLVPHAGLAFGTHGQKQYFGIVGAGDPIVYSFGQDTTMLKSKLTLLDAGCGMHYMPVTNILAVLDFGFQYGKIKDEYTLDVDSAARIVNNTTTMLPYWKIGLEGEVFNWLDVRFGAVSDWKSSKLESDFVTDVKRNEAANNTYLGFGFNWNRLHVDAYTNPNLFLRGFNFISGSNEDMNFRLSALYEMF